MLWTYSVPLQSHNHTCVIMKVPSVSYFPSDGGTVPYFSSDGGTITSLGRMSGEPVVSSDGVVELRYHHGAECGNVGRRWTTSLLFICTRGSEVL